MTTAHDIARDLVRELETSDGMFDVEVGFVDDEGDGDPPEVTLTQAANDLIERRIKEAVSKLTTLPHDDFTPIGDLANRGSVEPSALTTGDQI